MTAPTTPPAGRDPELLTAYLDGELDAAQAAEVRAWIEADPAARAEFDGLARVRSLVRGLPAVEPPFGFYERILLDARRGRAPSGRRRGLGLAGAAAAAVAAVVLLVGIAPAPAGAVVPPVDEMAQRHEMMQAAPDPVAVGSAGSSGGFEAVPDVEVDAMPAPMVAPARMGPMTREVVFHSHEGMLHVVYGDGTHKVSLFEQPGAVEWDALPGGSMASTPAGTAWMGSAGRSTTVMVTQRDGVVFTVVASMPGEEVVGMIGEIPAPAAPSVLERVRDACAGLNRSFALGD